MATGIEIKDLPEIPLTYDTKLLCQNVDGTGSATFMNARRAIGVSIDRAEAAAEAVDAGSEPSVSLAMTGTDQNKEMDFSFRLPKATKIKSFVTETRILEANEEPSAEIVEGGDVNEREYTLKLALGKSTEITGVTAQGVVKEAGTEPTVSLETGGTPSQRTYGLTFGLPRAMELTDVTAEAAVIDALENATAEVTQGGTPSERTLHFAFGIPKGDPGVIENVTAEIARGAPDSASTVEITQGGTPSSRTYHLKFSLPEVPAIVPVGFIYIQFAGQSTPDALFGGTWENISSQFAGEFFRAEGGNAVEFGNSQKEGLPNIVGYYSASELTEKVKDVYATGCFFDAGNHPSSPYNADGEKDGAPGMIGFDASRFNTIYGASKHVTPVNSTIRIWKRTA